jgi:RNA polymerase sigma-70 factor (ECF subfamily)
VEQESRDDSRLLEAAREGDVEAFAELVRRHERALRAVAGRLIGDTRDAEEAVQDAFVRAWRNLDRFRGDSAPFTWLYRIAVNEALQRGRRKRVSTVPLEDADRRVAAPGADAGAETGAMRKAVLDAIDALEPEYRAPLVLRDIGGLSNEEVAGVLELSLAATKSRIHRARLSVRNHLEDAGFG